MHLLAVFLCRMWCRSADEVSFVCRCMFVALCVVQLRHARIRSVLQFWVRSNWFSSLITVNFIWLFMRSNKFVVFCNLRAAQAWRAFPTWNHNSQCYQWSVSLWYVVFRFALKVAPHYERFGPTQFELLYASIWLVWMHAQHIFMVVEWAVLASDLPQMSTIADLGTSLQLPVNFAKPWTCAVMHLRWSSECGQHLSIFGNILLCAVLFCNLT